MPDVARFVTLLALAGCLVWQAPALEALSLHAQPVTATVLEVGRYRVQGERRSLPAHQSTAGFSSVVEAELVAAGTAVPLRLGEAFGFRFAISDTQQHAEWIPVTIRIDHPPLIDHAGEPSRGFVMKSAARLGADGQYHNAAWYLLTRPHELAAGAWHIAVIYRGAVVASRTFDLRKDAASTVVQAAAEGLGTTP